MLHCARSLCRGAARYIRAPMPKIRELSTKQALFVAQYLVDYNATQAAIRAGYSKRTAKQMGAENLSKPDIKAAIAAALKPLQDRAKVTAARVLEEIAACAFIRLGDYVTAAGDVDIVRLAREQPAAIAELTAELLNVRAGKRSTTSTIKRRVKTHDKLEALGQLGRHFKLFATDVQPKDVPKTELPPAPARKIHQFTSEELRAIVQKGRDAKAAATGSRRRKR